MGVRADSTDMTTWICYASKSASTHGGIFSSLDYCEGNGH